MITYSDTSNNSLSQNVLYLKTINIGLSEKLDKVINPRLCTTTRVRLDHDLLDSIKSPINKPKLWITRVKQTSKIQSRTPKGGSKELLNKLINKEGQSLLHQASFYGKISIIQQLLKEGANINQEDWSGTTPLLYAIKANQLKAVQELIKHSDLKIQLKFGHQHETALIKAVKSGNAEIVKEICRNRPECVAKLDVNGRSALFLAILRGNSNMVAELIEAGSREKDLIDYKGLNAIYLAIDQGEVNSVETLLGFSEFVVSEKICEKLLVMGCYGNKISLVEAVLPHLPMECKVREEGLSPILISYTLGFKEITYVLMESSLNEEIDFVTEKGQFLLMAACLKNDSETVERITNRECRLDLKNSRGQTVLHVVCDKGYSECLEKILRRSLDVNLADKNGNTPAMLAAMSGKIEVLEKILERGAEIPSGIVASMSKTVSKDVMEIIFKYSQVKRVRTRRLVSRTIYG